VHLILGGVFLLSAAEAALFFGFVIPEEIAVLLGGVLASRGRVSLAAAVAAGVLGATIGDFIGFQVGRRFGAVASAPRLGASLTIGGDLLVTQETADACEKRVPNRLRSATSAVVGTKERGFSLRAGRVRTRGGRDLRSDFELEAELIEAR
jgi:hypothetical protein